ncbi:MAG: nuclear transport factor 2 family protein [Gemmatimonadota bacterium]|nr:nuclear transport factor 2 family protein [Gemmatimonadota bacterium]
MSPGNRILNGSVRHRVALGAAGLAVSLVACTIEPVGNGGDEGAVESDLATHVERILDEQAAAWNRGDLEGFMSSYESSPETSYIGASGLITGFDGIRGRYAPLFEAGAQRDSLRFESLTARELDARFGVATARYVLFRDGMTTSTGPFTLVMMRAEGVWKIVHDQSAEDPPDDAGESGDN